MSLFTFTITFPERDPVDVQVAGAAVKIGNMYSSLLKLDHASIGKMHAMIECSPDLRLIDLGSVRGTRVNDQAIRGQGTAISPGDVIMFGDVRTVLKEVDLTFRGIIPAEVNEIGVVSSATEFAINAQRDKQKAQDESASTAKHLLDNVLGGMGRKPPNVKTTEDEEEEPLSSRRDKAAQEMRDEILEEKVVDGSAAVKAVVDLIPTAIELFEPKKIIGLLRSFIASDEYSMLVEIGERVVGNGSHSTARVVKHIMDTYKLSEQTALAIVIHNENGIRSALESAKTAKVAGK